MPTATAKLIPALLIPFFAWRVYRRFQRNVGQQPLRPQRLITSIVVFGLVSVAVIAATFAAPKVLASFGGGLLLGLALAFVGLHLTRFETTAAGHFYTPNTYIGVALSVLLGGRILYRFSVILLTSPDANGLPPQTIFQSPLTVFLLGLTAGYYLTYSSGVLIKGERQKAGTIA